MAYRDSRRVAPRVLLGGGIGSGKSSVADMFRRRGFTVIDTDDVGREVLSRGSDATAAVGVRWPETVIDGVVDRAALARIVFADDVALGELERITHPDIRRRVQTRVEEADGPVLVEVPLIGVLADLEGVRVAVVAPPDVRLERAVGRGGDREDVARRMVHQDPDGAWRAWADEIIDNGGSREDTAEQVDRLIGRLLSDG